VVVERVLFLEFFGGKMIMVTAPVSEHRVRLVAVRDGEGEQGVAHFLPDLTALDQVRDISDSQNDQLMKETVVRIPMPDVGGTTYTDLQEWAEGAFSAYFKRRAVMERAAVGTSRPSVESEVW